MDITPLVAQDRQIIQSYSAKGFKVSGQLYEGAIAVFPDKVMPWDCDKSTDALTADDFSFISSKSDEFDVVLLGTGTHMCMIGQALKNELKAAGLHVECMDSGAACRTYNVLMTEGRRVATLLLKL